VDDEEIFTRNLAKLLTARGYAVTRVDSGDAALKTLEKNVVDVIVLDLKMPGIDGLTTLREIQKMDLPTRTLVLTGYGSVDSALAALKLGAFDYLFKPCEIDEIVAKIKMARQKNDIAPRPGQVGKLLPQP
jgi:ActR/RegA family two-component response regulator